MSFHFRFRNLLVRLRGYSGVGHSPRASVRLEYREVCWYVVGELLAFRFSLTLRALSWGSAWGTLLPKHVQTERVPSSDRARLSDRGASAKQSASAGPHTGRAACASAFGHRGTMSSRICRQASRMARVLVARPDDPAGHHLVLAAVRRGTQRRHCRAAAEMESERAAPPPGR